MNSSIPQLIPVDSAPENVLENIDIGDILIGDMILAGQYYSTGTKHRISITHKLSDDCFMGDHGGLMFEMESKGNHEYFSLSLVHKGTGVKMYYGTLHVESISKPKVKVIRDFGSKYPNHEDLPEFELPHTDPDNESERITNTPGTLAIIDTTQLNVELVVGAGEENDSKTEFNLGYLGELHPGDTLTGILERVDHRHRIEFESMSYQIHRVDARKILLTRTVYDPKIKKTKTKEYLLGDITLITSTNAIGTLSSLDGKEKGQFQFGTKGFQSKGGAVGQPFKRLRALIGR